MHVLLRLALVVLGAWSTGAVALSPYASEAVRMTLAVAFAIALVVAFRAVRKQRGLGVASLATIAACAVPLLAAVLLLEPSNERDWALDQSRLPRVEIAGDVATVHDVRNFRYRSTSDYDAAWEDRRYDLDEVESAWFIVEPFSSFAGAAHTFLSFGFANGDYLAVSVEIRKEKGESFSALKGLYRNYELMYVLGDERDLVALRTTYRKDTVYAYPLRVSKAGMRAMLEDIFARANALAAAPQFYDSLTNTCTTNIAAVANDVKPGVVPFSWQLVLPGYSDERALALGLVAFDGDIAQARERFRINERADAAAGAADFSVRIRDFPE
ncbi:MAG TPA: DUF4105 domain-containing protein [Xanthomonadales bacterium]|nr:DUF4105 domain-containing protein [Xanthomonadales bacterium]